MNAVNFEFNGIKSSDVNIMISSFNGSNNDSTITGNEISYNSTKSSRSNKWEFHSSKYESPLSFTFQICKNLCNSKNPEFTSYEKAYYESWLCRTDGYRYLRFFQDTYENIYYNCYMNIKWKEIAGRSVGAELTVTCDAPYGYSPIQTFEYTNNSSNSFIIYNDSDNIGSVNIQQVEIQILSAGNLELENNMDALYPYNYNGQPTIISNCTAGEIITIDSINNQIKTNNSNHDIVNNFNYVFPHLINIDNVYPYSKLLDSTISFSRKNVFTVSGCKCNINFSYRTIRKAVV